MTKYYKVIKENPLWEVGAIISNEKDSTEYIGVNDIWDKFEDMAEYLSPVIVEKSPEFFQRVYKSGIDKIVYLTKEKLKEAYEKFKE